MDNTLEYYKQKYEPVFVNAYGDFGIARQIEKTQSGQPTKHSVVLFSRLAVLILKTDSKMRVR